LGLAFAQGLLGLPQLHALFASVIVAQARENAGNRAQEPPAFFGIFRVTHFVQSLADFVQDKASQCAAEVPAVGSAFEIQFAGAFEHFHPLRAAVASVGPIDIAAVAPFREILLRDGASAEKFGEDALDFRQSVEPGKNLSAGLTVFETAVEFFADMFGQACDFSGSGCIE